MITPLRIGIEFDTGKLRFGMSKAKASMQEITKSLQGEASKRDTAQSNLAKKKESLTNLRSELRATEKAVDEVTKELKKLEAAKTKALAGTSASVKKKAIREEYDPQIASKQAELARRTAEMRTGQDQVAAAEANVNSYKGQVDAASESIKRMEKEQKELAKTMKDTGEGTRSTAKRIKELVKSAFMFTVITKALTALRTGLVNLIKSDSQAAKSLAQIKGGLISAFMPIYNFVLPAIRALLSFLAQLVNAIASVMRGLFGATGAANSTAEALGNAGSAGGGAAKSLAAFDEINQLNGGGGGGGGGGLSADYSGLTEVSGTMKEIASWVLAIGAGIASWKIGKALGAFKGAGFLRNIRAIAGLALAFKGGAEYISSYIDAWKNGLNDINSADMLGGTLELVGGLTLGFGKTGAVIGLAATGIANIVLGLKDIISNGFNLKNVGTTISGIGSSLAAFALARNNPILAGIGLIVMALGEVIRNWQAICDWVDTAARKVAEFLGIKPENVEAMTREMVQSVGQKIHEKTGLTLDENGNLVGRDGEIVVTPDMNIFERVEALEGYQRRGRTLDVITGINLGQYSDEEEVQDALSEIIRSNGGGVNREQTSSTGYSVIGKSAGGLARSSGVVSMDAATQKKELTAVMKNTEKQAGKLLKPTVENIVDSADVGGALDAVTPDAVAGAERTWKAMQGVFSGVGAWLKNTFAQAWRGVAGVFSGSGSDSVASGMSNAFKSMLNSLIKRLNNMFDSTFGQLNKAFSNLRGVTIAGSRPFANLGTVNIPEIPRLAAGAVIPANHEFLAVLGDQKSGTNIEAPLDTIVDAMITALNRSGNNADIVAAIRSAFTGMAIKVDKTTIGYVVADSINANRRASGKVALNL